MNTLEFENTQGISLEYPTATIVERGVAFFIDLVVLIVAIFIIEVAFKSVIPNNNVRVIALEVPVFFFYTLLMEILNDGRSLGKMAMGLKVVRIDGRYPNSYDYLMRWMFRWVDIYMTFGALASIMVGGTPNSQRVGDLLADTTVIRTRNLRVALERVTNLQRITSEKVTFPQAKDLNEEQALIIMETLDRAKKYKNKAHEQALHDLAKRLRIMLQIETKGAPSTFLKVLIKDYISLTR